MFKKVGSWFKSTKTDNECKFQPVEPPVGHLWGRSSICAMAAHGGPHGLNLIAFASASGIIRIISKDVETIVARDLVVSALWFITDYLVGLARDELVIWDLAHVSTAPTPLSSSPIPEESGPSGGSSPSDGPPPALVSCPSGGSSGSDSGKYSVVKLPYETYCAEPLYEAEAILLGTSEGNVLCVDLFSRAVTGFVIHFQEHVKGKEKAQRASCVSCMAINESTMDLLIGFEDGFAVRYSIPKRQTKKTFSLPEVHNAKAVTDAQTRSSSGTSQSLESVSVASVMWLRRDEKSGHWIYLILYTDGTLDEHESSKKRRTMVDKFSEFLGKEGDMIWCSSQEGIYALSSRDWTRTVILSEHLREAVFIPPFTMAHANKLKSLDCLIGKKKYASNCVAPIGSPAPPWNVEFDNDNRPKFIESMVLSSMVLALTEDHRLIVAGLEWSWEFEWGSLLWQAPSFLAFKEINLMIASSLEEPTGNLRPVDGVLSGRENALLDLVDKCISLRCAHFEECCSGRKEEGKEEVKKWNVSRQWNAAVGGTSGVYLTGHEDGACRIWLSSAGALLLIHQVSLTTRPALSYRPLYNSEAPERVSFFDGIDAAPCFAPEPEWGTFLTAIDLRASADGCYLALGSKEGAIALFKWNDDEANMSPAEATELQVCSMLDSNPDEVIPPKLAAGFQCIMRTNDHKGSITSLLITNSSVVVLDDEAMVSITTFAAECVFLDDLGVSMSMALDLNRVATVAAEGVLILPRERAVEEIPLLSTTEAPEVDVEKKIPELLDDSVDPVTYAVALSNGKVREIHREGSLFELVPPEESSILNDDEFPGTPSSSDKKRKSRSSTSIVSPNSSVRSYGVTLLFRLADGDPLIVRTRALFYKGQVLKYEQEPIRAAELLLMDGQLVVALWSSVEGVCKFVSLASAVGVQFPLSFLDVVIDTASILGDRKSRSGALNSDKGITGPSNGDKKNVDTQFRCIAPLGYVHIGPHGRAVVCATSRHGLSTQLSILPDKFSLDQLGVTIPKLLLMQTVSQMRKIRQMEAEQVGKKTDKHESSGSNFFKGIFQKEKKPLRSIVCVPPPAPRKEKEVSDRDKLFANVIEQSSSAAGSAENTVRNPRKSEEVGRQTKGAFGAASDARTKLADNVQQLGQLDDKMQQMAQDSEDFLNLAKKLNQKSKNQWF